jgi:hypothetical protein
LMIKSRKTPIRNFSVCHFPGVHSYLATIKQESRQ